MIKVIKWQSKGDSVYSSLVFRLAGPRIDLAVRHFQSFIPNSGKKLKTVHARMQLKRRPALKQKTEVLKFYTD